MTDLADLTITEVAGEIRSGRLSPVDLVDAVLDRIGTVEPRIAAFTVVDGRDARRAAQRLTDELTRGAPRSALHGVPLGIKDVIDVEGMPTRAGSRVLDDTPASVDAPAVAMLRSAGAIIIGKTTTHEFAFGCETPPTRNPWRLDCIPGGSSGGSGAAVAAGECLGALGTDSGGSVRVPAALCGISGLRPTRGRVSLAGTVPFSWSHDTIGPMARTVEDVGLLWGALSGDAPPVPARLDEVRIAAPPDLQVLGELDDEVAAAADAAVDEMVRAGASRVPADVPPFGAWDGDRFTVVLSDVLAAHSLAGWYPARRERYGAEMQSYLAQAEAIRGADLVLARRQLDVLAARLAHNLDDADVLVLPTVAVPAPPAGEGTGSQSPNSGITPTTVQLIRLCAPISYCGLAAVSVPSGQTADGRPLGIQVVARDEPTALAVAAAFQELTDHHSIRPPIHDL